MSRTVLLIDDDLQFYGQLCQVLSNYDFEVHQADVSEESLNMATDLAAEVIIIAVDLPDKVGFALCHKAKKSLSAPIVLKTNTIPPEGFKKHSRLKSHADRYLDVRQLSEDDLLDTIDSLIGLGEQVADDEVGIEVEELEMDEIDIDDFSGESFDSAGEATAGEFPEESTNVAAPAAFLDSQFDAETDAAFAALGFDEDKPARSFDTSDVASAGGDEQDAPGFSVQLEEVTAVANEQALEAAEAETALAAGYNEDLPLEDEQNSDRPTTHVAPEDELSDELPDELPDELHEELSDEVSVDVSYELEESGALEGEDDGAPAMGDVADNNSSYELELDEGDEQAASDAVPSAIASEVSESFSAVPNDDLGEVTSFGSDPMTEEGYAQDAAPVFIEDIPEEAPEIEEVAVSDDSPSLLRATEPEEAPAPELSADQPDLAPLDEQPDESLDLGLEAVAMSAAIEQEAASNVGQQELNDLHTEITQLKAELATARAAGAGAGAGEFSREREFLDLREKINKKEKALLDAQDQLTAKDRELLDSKDKLSKLERSKAELDDKNLELEHEVLRSKEQQRGLADNIKSIQQEMVDAQASHARQVAEAQKEHAAALAEAASSHSDALAGAEARHAQDLSKAKSEHEAARSAALESMQEDFEAKLEQAESGKQAALAEAAAKLSAELRAAEEAKAQALAELAQTHEQAIAEQEQGIAEHLAELEKQHQAAMDEASAAFAQERQGLVDQHAGKFSRLERESNEAREALEASHAQAREEQQAAHESERQAQQEQHESTLAKAQAAAEAALAAAKSASEAALAAAAEAQEEALQRAAEEHEVALREALAAAEARRTQELKVAADNLAALDERRREELNAAAEEREASEAQLLAKANSDRAALEQEHAEVVAGHQRENNELQTALSGSRDNISALEASLAKANEEIAQQLSTLQSKEQIIALRDDRIAALKGEIAELEEQNAGYQEQVLKAYQRIKSDESTVARAKKAMAIALTLLDETSDLSVDTDAPPADTDSAS